MPDALESYRQAVRHYVVGELCHCVPPYTDARAPHAAGGRARCLVAAAALVLAKAVDDA